MKQSSMNIKRGRFFIKNRGFVTLEMMIVLPIIFMILVTAFIISKSIGSTMLAYMDRYVLQYQTADILDSISTELMYADEVIMKKDFANKDLLIIKTRRRASAKESTFGEKKINCIGYKKERYVIYRCEMIDWHNGYITEVSKQPMSGSYYWGEYDMEYKCKKLDENLYEISVSGTSRFHEKFSLKTAVICRNKVSYD